MKTFFDEIYRRYGDPEAFVKKVRDRLELYDISQNQLAKRTGYHPTHVSRWLRLKVVPSMESMVRMDEALERLVEGD